MKSMKFQSKSHHDFIVNIDRMIEKSIWGKNQTNSEDKQFEKEEQNWLTLSDIKTYNSIIIKTYY